MDIIECFRKSTRSFYKFTLTYSIQERIDMVMIIVECGEIDFGIESICSKIQVLEMKTMNSL